MCVYVYSNIQTQMTFCEFSEGFFACASHYYILYFSSKSTATDNDTHDIHRGKENLVQLYCLLYIISVQNGRNIIIICNKNIKNNE